jgi:hypothetical protein
MIKFLVVLGLLLLLITFVVLFSGVPTRSGVPSATNDNGIAVRRADPTQKKSVDTPEEGDPLLQGPRPLATPSPCPDCTLPLFRGASAFQWKWPRRLDTRDEGTVSFSVLTTEDIDFSTQEALPDEGSGTERPKVGVSQSAPLAYAFGSGYKAVARASLDAPSFNRTPAETVEKVLDNNEAQWQWTVTPLSEGSKVLTVNLRIDWTGNDKRHPPQSREWKKTLKCDVSKPLVAVGTFEFLPWLTGISGATFLGIAGLIFGKRKLQQGKEQRE